jgi:hypothetical protein
MTKKDYILIARVIKGEIENRGADSTGKQIIGELARVLAGELKTQNERFNRDTFLKACNVDTY